MKQYRREELQKKLWAEIENGRPIIASGAGAGIVAKASEKAGVDLLIVYSTGKFRLAGAPLLTTMLAYDNCNDIVKKLGRKVLYRTMEVPVIGAIGAADPFEEWDVIIDQLLELGFSGMINYPVYTGIAGFADDLNDSGIGLDQNEKLIKHCRKRDFFSSTFVFNEEQAHIFAAAGADMICAMMGGTAGGTNAIKKEKIRSMEECCEMIQRICEIVAAENPKSIVTCHGGPIVTAGDLQMCLDCTDVKGFVGGSSVERIPVERAVYLNTKEIIEMNLCRDRESI